MSDGKRCCAGEEAADCAAVMKGLPYFTFNPRLRPSPLLLFFLFFQAEETPAGPNMAESPVDTDTADVTEVRAWPQIDTWNKDLQSRTV